MRVVPLFWITIFTALMLWAAPGHAQSTIQLFDEDARVNLSDNFALYYEEDTPLTIQQILKRRQNFQWFMADNPNFGFRENGLWLTNKISNVSNLQSWVFSIDFSQLDKVDFYLVADGVLLQQSHQGKLQPEQIFRNPTLRADLPIATPLELFIRVQSHSSSLIVPLTVAPSRSTVSRFKSTVRYGACFMVACVFWPSIT
nr:7TM-DISM domain-containing protein [Salinimonas marina]